jgi:hypothetical protein
MSQVQSRWIQIGRLPAGCGVQTGIASLQTLEQMRSESPLSSQNPPQRVPVFLPACSTQDFSCSWHSFAQAIRELINPHSEFSK